MGKSGTSDLRMESPKERDRVYGWNVGTEMSGETNLVRRGTSSESKTEFTVSEEDPVGRL